MFNQIKRIIPNTLTCCNLMSGCMAVVFALSLDFKMAMWWIVIGAVFDFFDGMSARLLNVSSPIGKELDSLADVTTFGVAPAAMLCSELSVMDYPSMLEPLRGVLPYAAFVMAAFSALRLAKFNLDKRQTTSFIGLPTPANALFWASLLVSCTDFIESSPLMVVATVAAMLLSSWLMVSEIPMFALKFKHWKWRGNEVRMSFMLFSAVMLVLFGFGAFWLIIASYFLISCILDLRNRSAKASEKQ